MKNDSVGLAIVSGILTFIGVIGGLILVSIPVQLLLLAPDSAGFAAPIMLLITLLVDFAFYKAYAKQKTRARLARFIGSLVATAPIFLNVAMRIAMQ